jgi:hypothetical protein
MITIERRKVNRSGFARTGWQRPSNLPSHARFTITTEQWCVMENGKVLAECRSEAIAERIRAALAGEVET